MNFFSLNDFHLTIENPIGRLDNIVKTAHRKLKDLHLLTKEHKPSFIVVAGDLFDVPRSWLNLAEYVMDIKKISLLCPIYSVFGQHDTYYYNEESKRATSLGFLDRAGVVKCLSDNPYTEEGIKLFGCDFEGKIPKPKKTRHKKILVIHARVIPSFGEGRNVYRSGKSWTAPQFLNDYPDYDIICVGDYHRRFKYISKDGRAVFNSGPGLRLDADTHTMAFTPGVWNITLENGKADAKFFKFPSAKLGSKVLSRSHIESENIKKTNLTEFKELLKETMEQNVDEGEVDFYSNLQMYLNKKKVRKRIRLFLNRSMEEEVK